MSSQTANFYHATCDTRKAIVVDLGFLGDTIQLVPALSEIKRHYPQAELHVLTTPVGAEVLNLVSGVHRVWSVELHPQRRSLRQQWKLIRALRRERFDLAFNFSGADRTLFWTVLTGARYRVAHAAGRKHFWNSWLIPLWVARQPPAMPVYEQRRQVLAACGLSLAPPCWSLAVPKEATRKAESLVPSGAIHFSVNASTPLKEWPLEKWIALAKRLFAENPSLRIVASGSCQPREQEQLRSLAAGVGDTRLSLLTGLSIAELAAGLQRCRLHLGADSGVLHLAVAVGLPTISIFRDYQDARAWMPTGPEHRIFKMSCQCVNQHEQPCLTVNRAECLAKLDVRAVEMAVRELLQISTPG